MNWFSDGSSHVAGDERARARAKERETIDQYKTRRILRPASASPTTHMRTTNGRTFTGTAFMPRCPTSESVPFVRCAFDETSAFVVCSLLHSDVVSFKLDYYWHVEFNRSTMQINRLMCVWMAENAYCAHRRRCDILKLHNTRRTRNEYHSCAPSHKSNNTNLCARQFECVEWSGVE